MTAHQDPDWLDEILDELVLQADEDGNRTVNGITTIKSEAKAAITAHITTACLDELNKLREVAFDPYNGYARIEELQAQLNTLGGKDRDE